MQQSPQHAVQNDQCLKHWTPESCLKPTTALPCWLQLEGTDTGLHRITSEGASLLAGDPVPFALTPKVTNERSLEAAVKYASEFLNKAVKPVMVGGVKMRWPGKAQDAFLKLSEAGGPVGNCSVC